MGSSSTRSSKSSYAIVVDDRSYRSTSTNSYDTMSSRGSYSGVGSGSGSYTPSSSSSNVIQGQARSSKAADYKVDIFQRGSVSVYNHYSTGYEQNAPHPSYQGTGGNGHNPRTHP
ncbi:hypothetical protein F4677DRAFT_139777 [Hypoxylon crocopeplum]|nr:hypothetical protein F4677DRAFT_139777 [Hypoxylon crocopeplum]